MNLRRMIAVVAVAAVLACGTVTPSPVRADASEPLVLAGIALGAYIGVVVVGTAIVYGRRDKLTLAPEDLDLRRDGQQPAVRTGRHCRQTSTSLTLVCW